MSRLRRVAQCLNPQRMCYSTLYHPENYDLPPMLPSGLPPAKDFQVKKARFVKSSGSMDQLPFPEGPEFAFIGHSNVGKSSLINMLTGVKDLAKVSKKPGTPLLHGMTRDMSLPTMRASGCPYGSHLHNHNMSVMQFHVSSG